MSYHWRCKRNRAIDRDRAAELDNRAVRLDHFCLVIESTDLDALAASGEFDVIEDPAVRSGARGDGLSLYVRDPDGTTIELRCYP